MVAKKRMFNKTPYTLAGEYSNKWQVENAKDRLRSKGFYHFHTVRVESKAPPQGDVFIRLYYRR